MSERSEGLVSTEVDCTCDGCGGGPTTCASIRDGGKPGREGPFTYYCEDCIRAMLSVTVLTIDKGPA